MLKTLKNSIIITLLLSPSIHALEKSGNTNFYIGLGTYHYNYSETLNNSFFMGHKGPMYSIDIASECFLTPKLKLKS